MIYVLAFLMVSNIRYFSFKELNLSRRKPFNIFIFIILSITVILMEPVIVFSGIILLYVFSGPFNTIRAWQKKKKELRIMGPVPEEDPVTRG
jgi:CDP-diacylglycerol--serine O-phosphatidyltransferase